MDKSRNTSSLYSAAIVSVLFISLVLAGGCAPKRKFISPEVELLGLDVKDVSLSHINYRATVRVYNPNLEPLDITDVQYSLYLNGINMVNGESQVDQTVRPHEEVKLPLRLSGSLFSTLRFLASMPNARKISFVMKGTIIGSSQSGHSFALPFEEKGDLDLQNLRPL